MTILTSELDPIRAAHPDWDDDQCIREYYRARLAAYEATHRQTLVEGDRVHFAGEKRPEAPLHGPRRQRAMGDLHQAVQLEADDALHDHRLRARRSRPGEPDFWNGVRDGRGLPSRVDAIGRG
jgi:hypothetical protein